MVHIIGQRYELLEELGAGGMGTVYKAQDTHTKQTVAVKHLKPEMSQTDLIERFKREGEALRELNHPNIVKMLEAIEQDGNHYLVMEYLPGGDLRSVFSEQSAASLPVKQILQVAVEISDALTRAHHLNIIHRDLKPANVLLADDGTPRLTDFGVAHVVAKERLTDSGMMVGTLDYMSPEVLNGEAIDNRADIWAFGVMLFEMLAGEKPFKGDNLSAVVAAILTQQVPDLETIRPDIPVALVDLVYRMLEKDRNARIASVRHIGAALEDILHKRDSAPLQSRFKTPAPADTVVYQRPQHNLPAQITPFVGREAELRELTKLLADPSIRLITIAAPGGMGKTRLALELASRALISGQLHSGSGEQVQFANGAYFVELAHISDPTNIIPAIAEATGYHFQQDGREPKQQILDFLANKSMLLVLDNFEHLLDGGELVTDILKAAPEVQIIVTSRQRLSQPGESLFFLVGMDFPDWETPEDALEYSAVKLFMNSARRAQPTFELTAGNLDYVARICRLVEGMPLGIVLAAAWLAMLSPEEIAAEIEQSIDFLESVDVNVPERQHSIRAVFDYSWQMMTNVEKQVFMRLSVFRGGFTREAAAAVAGANLRTLLSLMHKSLIRRDADSGRFEIHELLRQYASEQLEAAGQLRAARDDHAAYYANAMYERQSHLKDYRQVAALRDIASDFENVQVAWLWAVQHKDLDSINKLLPSLARYCVMRARYQEGLALLDNGLEKLSAAVTGEKRYTRGRILALRTRLANVSLQSSQEIHNMGKEALQIARDSASRQDIALGAWALGYSALRQGYREEGKQLLEEALAIYREIGDRGYEQRVLLTVAYAHAIRGGLDGLEQAGQFWRQSLRIGRELGEKYFTGIVLANLGVSELKYRRHSQAEAYLREARALAIELGAPHGTVFILINLTDLYMAKGELEKAEASSQQALALARDMNHRLWVLSSLHAFAKVKVARGQYTAARQLAEESWSLSQLGDAPSVTGEGKLMHSLALCGLGDYVTAAAQLYDALQIVATSAQEFQLTECVFGISIVLAFHENEPVRALELASLVAHHPAFMMWEIHPLAERLLDLLQETLEPDIYKNAWERGKTLDLQTVVQELVAQLGTE